MFHRHLPADFVKWDKLPAGVSTMAMEPWQCPFFVVIHVFDQQKWLFQPRKIDEYDKHGDV